MTVVAPTGRADAGDRIDYTLTASNSGNTTLTGVTVSDPKLGALACTPPQPATLLPGQQISCTGSYTLTQADLDAGTVHNVATADSDRDAAGQRAQGRRHHPGAGADAGQGEHGRHDGRRAAHPCRRRRQDRLHADGDERGQRDAHGRDDRRSEARHARVHSDAAGDARARRSSSSAPAATRSPRRTSTPAPSTTSRRPTASETPPVDTPKDTAITKEPALALVKQGTVDMTVVGRDRPRRRRRPHHVHADREQRRAT